ncbi:hypothetical protein AB0A73_08900 [Glycomyces sp. NPDC047369]
MGRLRFAVEGDGSIEISGGGDRYRDLGAMIRLDIGTNNHVCLDYLCSIAEVENGTIQFGLHEGEVYETLIERHRVTVTHEFLDRSEEFEFAEFKEIIETYWKTIYGLRSAPHIVRERPDLSESDASLLGWEKYWQKRHPYRGRIEGIPASGPE